MKNIFSKFNTNWLAIALLFGAFIVSAVRFYIVSGQTGDGGAEGGARVIRVAHWQLEPGFREALEWVMEEYNALPEVQAAGVTVMQSPIAEKVYNQFMNVHLISGTAPDIAVKRESELVKGNALAKFYTPLGSHVETPNPYNAPEYQLPSLPDDFANSLSKTPWRDTFFDGLQGGYEETLSDYYAIPICTWGGTRMIYNMSILQAVKEFSAKLAQQQPQPEWMQSVWRTPDNENGFLPEESGVEWLSNNSEPQTLGQLMLYCVAIKAYQQASGLDYLVPVAASSYAANGLASLYSTEMMSGMWQDYSLELGKKPTSIEALAGFERGVWGFNSAMLQEYYEFNRLLVEFYPQGYMGLDREQAQRRFVLGQAAILCTGGWDATSIYQGIQGRSNPADRFEVLITPEPFPVAGERWADVLTMRASEADAKGGVPFAINKQTPNFDWALDFLRFISSHRINEGFAQRAGWLPVISGTKAPEDVEAFLPIAEGVPKDFALSVGSSNVPMALRNVWTSTVKLFIAGDIDYSAMAERITRVFEDSSIGIRKAWVTTLQQQLDKSRANQRSMSVERLGAMLGSTGAASRERSNTYLNLIEDEGVFLKRWWHELYPNEPYPTY
ncbi:extracellular solute-binding protein [Coraliomargarita algicola]|uniref:Extracellular solute-binding protein n=1 Tax=Coraliomargarita algicola TaxID=3092156 RepID=A0ABZ0RJS7_9BACT|nr:extracellular solute-binding protein [Coraliomargarita sp. J2-16]WPJ96465.1 extracellular solute-binding protein [Coraliomargarita sp. J2-16]